MEHLIIDRDRLEDFLARYAEYLIGWNIEHPRNPIDFNRLQMDQPPLARILRQHPRPLTQIPTRAALDRCAGREHRYSMRALLAGISGVNKDIVVANLLDRLCANGDISASPGADGRLDPLIGPDPRELFAASVEDVFERQGDDLASTLAAFRPRYQLGAWQRAGLAIAEQMEDLDPRHSLLATHLTYYTSGRQFSLIDIPTIRRWRPDCIITLVDDMLDIRAALGPTGYRAAYPLPVAAP